jgi:Domain of unknown function (DUF4132)
VADLSAGVGSGFLARLKQSVFGSTHPVEADLIALVDEGRFQQVYRDRSDEEKIAVIARVARLYATPQDRWHLANDAGALVATLKSLDLPGARTILGFAAAFTPFSNSIKPSALANLLERQPAGTFHDAELRQGFQRMKAGWIDRKLPGSDVARRIEAALGPVQTSPAWRQTSAPRADTSDATTDQLLDTWIDAWMHLIAELRLPQGELHRTMLARSRQAQRILASNDAIGHERWMMDLDDGSGEGRFLRRLSYLNGELDFATFDRPWLARLREQEAAWHKLGPSTDWFGAAIPGLATLSEIRVGSEQTLVEFLRTLATPKPNAKWSKRAAELASGAQGDAIRQALIDWLTMLPVPGSASGRARLWPDVAEYRNFRRQVLDDVRLTGSPAAAALIAFFDDRAPFRIYPDGSGGYGTDEPDPAMLSEVAALLARSAVWMLAHWRDAAAVAALQTAAQATLMRLAAGRHSVNYRSLAVANAAILALGEIATGDAVQALGRIKLKLRDERLVKQIAAAMELAAGHAGMTVADLQELAVPTFDLDEVGVRTVALGELTATLRVRSTTDVAVELARADGKLVKSVPAAVKADADASAALKQLKAAAKSIAEALPVHRQRLESLYLTRRAWPLPAWRERFLDHPLVGTLARRLIWTVTARDGSARALIWHDGRLVDATGDPAADLADDGTVTLWHPLEAAGEEVAAWRAFLLRHKLVQPFKQAHRELYPLTDAERATRSYSNRFAGHILRQHQSVALARQRGWQAALRINADVANDEPTHLRIPDFGLAAELWTQPAGGDDAECTANQAFVFIATDRVCFRRFSPADGGVGDPVALEEVPPRVFSEVLRDVDLCVGVASIGNDPSWRDGGAGAAHPSRWGQMAARYWTDYSTAALAVAGESRRQLIAELIPSLAIADRCTLSDRHLIVRGRWHAYRIHLGSGNILMEDDRYLCIVPASRMEDATSAFLPFEGDRMLSLILSKAIMLADDDKITDAGIRSQLGK